MEFKVRSSTPSQYRSPAKQFLAEHGGIVVTTIIVIFCILFVIRAQLADNSEQDEGQGQNALFDPMPDQQPQDSTANLPASHRTGSSLDARPVWGMPAAMDDEGGPIEGKKDDDKFLEAEKPPPPPDTGTGGIAMPNITPPPAEEVKKRLPKPTGTGNTSRNLGGGGGTFQPVASLEDRERREKDAKARTIAPESPPLGTEHQAGKPNLTKGRQMTAVAQEKGAGPMAGLEKLGVQKELIYTLQSISQNVEKRTQESGAPAAITASEARSIEAALGIKSGGVDKMPSPNANQ